MQPVTDHDDDADLRLGRILTLDDADDTDPPRGSGEPTHRYWLPPAEELSGPNPPWRRGNSLRWLLGAGVLVLVTLVAGVLILGNALTGISTSPQAKAIDGYASALQAGDTVAIGSLACAADAAQVQQASTAVAGSGRINSAARSGGMHRDSAGAGHATVRVRRVDMAELKLTVDVVKNGSDWCVSSVLPQL